MKEVRLDPCSARPQHVLLLEDKDFSGNAISFKGEDYQVAEERPGNRGHASSTSISRLNRMVPSHAYLRSGGPFGTVTLAALGHNARFNAPQVPIGLNSIHSLPAVRLKQLQPITSSSFTASADPPEMLRYALTGLFTSIRSSKASC